MINLVMSTHAMLVPGRVSRRMQDAYLKTEINNVSSARLWRATVCSKSIGRPRSSPKSLPTISFSYSAIVTLAALSESYTTSFTKNGIY